MRSCGGGSWRVGGLVGRIGGSWSVGGLVGWGGLAGEGVYGSAVLGEVGDG